MKIDPKDANGNAVPVFAYNGTTYLPIRALSGALGKPIQWDGAANSVYVGRHSGSKPAVPLRDMDYFYASDYEFETFNNMKDNLGNERYNVLYCYEERSRAYLLNGQYSAISGTLFQRYECRSNTEESTIEIYGDGKLLYRGTVSAGVQPVDFKVSVQGVLQLEVKFDFKGYCYSVSDNYSCAGVADLGLWT